MNPSPQTQNILSLMGRILMASLFVPFGFAKIAGFAGTVGYIAAKGLPLPEVCAAIAIAAELGLGLLLLVGWQTRWAALGLAVFGGMIGVTIFGIFLTPVFFVLVDWAAGGGLFRSKRLRKMSNSTMRVIRLEFLSSMFKWAGTRMWQSWRSVVGLGAKK